MQRQNGGDGFASMVLAAAANGIEQMIHVYRGDIDGIFGRANLNTREIASPYNELSLKQYCCLFEEAARQTGNGNFGLRFGNGFMPERLGAIGYIAVNSPTMSSALRNLVYYFPAHQDHTTLTLSEDEGTVRLNYQIADQEISCRRQDAELSLGMFCNIFKHCLGACWAPLEIHFEHSLPYSGNEHEVLFGAPVLFGQRTNSIVFRQRDWDAVMPDADPFLFAVVEPILAERRSLRFDPEYFVRMLKERIRLRLGAGDLSLAGVAEEMGMSSSALQRRLKGHSMSFKGLVRAARQELALRYVGGSDVCFTELALALGYSEQSAFSRAFRQWTGMSPRCYRNKAWHTLRR